MTTTSAVDGIVVPPSAVRAQVLQKVAVETREKPLGRSPHMTSGGMAHGQRAYGSTPRRPGAPIGATSPRAAHVAEGRRRPGAERGRDAGTSSPGRRGAGGVEGHLAHDSAGDLLRP